ncbi:hypothetical protein FN846DRAFT_56755 [Sphaerosporella brunnea]|uniref:Uncharacterized protein n=1 Tax=Sphaerosporella brunnea TaxID=1250544 RepID=A0A5J5F9Q6_9PEZI|nr:hypothetical protein FN846DRAFT_56755 [Sphaerosporella brunnea]
MASERWRIEIRPLIQDISIPALMFELPPSPSPGNTGQLFVVCVVLNKPFRVWILSLGHHTKTIKTGQLPKSRIIPTNFLPPPLQCRNKDAFGWIADILGGLAFVLKNVYPCTGGTYPPHHHQASKSYFSQISWREVPINQKTLGFLRFLSAFRLHPLAWLLCASNRHKTWHSCQKWLDLIVWLSEFESLSVPVTWLPKPPLSEGLW